MRQLVALGACLALSACSGSTVAAAPRSASTPATAPAPALSPATAPPSTLSSLPRPSLTPSSGPLGVSTTLVQGRHGRITYHLTLPVFTGPQADLVNARVRRSADEGVTSGTRDVPADVTGEIDTTGVVTVNDGRSVQIRLPFLYNAQGAAHPTDTVSTVALRRADAQPLLLTDVFTDPAPALAVALQHASEVATTQGQDNPSAFLTTKISDWANWQSGPTGITFFFDDYAAGSHAAGLRSVEVPWTLLHPYLRDDAHALLAPP